MGLFQLLGGMFGNAGQQQGLAGYLQPQGPTSGGGGLPGGVMPGSFAGQTAQPHGVSGFLNNVAQNLLEPTNALGRLGKALSESSGGGWGKALATYDVGRQQQMSGQLDQAYKMAQISHMADGAEDPSIIRTADALGLQRGTPEFKQWVTNAVTTPRYMTMASPDGGQNVLQLGGAGDDDTSQPSPPPPPRPIQQPNVNFADAYQSQNRDNIGALDQNQALARMQAQAAPTSAPMQKLTPYPQVSDAAGYAKLPSGARFRDPQGNVRVKR